MMSMLKALLLTPACLGGLLAGLPFVVHPGRQAERNQAMMMSGVSTLIVVGVVLFLVSRGAEHRFLGHSPRTWAVLCGIAYVLGLSLTILTG